MYKALVRFVDLQDHNHEYKPGDVFPRPGLGVSVERLRELSTTSNRRGTPVIVFVKDPVPAKKEPVKKDAVPDDFINPPEPPDEKPDEEPVKPEKPAKKTRAKVDKAAAEKPKAEAADKPRRGRRKKADVN